MFDLNSSEFQEKTIFNNGQAGLVRDVEISVETKEPGSNQPDYKLLAKDNFGTVNGGFYIPTPNPQRSDEENIKSEKLQVGRIVHIARAVMGPDYQFPEYQGTAAIYKGLFELISTHSKGKKYNVFVTYGTDRRPSQYLQLRYFNFIEPAGGDTKLVPGKTDLLEKLTQDTPESDPLSSLDTKPNSQIENAGQFKL